MILPWLKCCRLIFLKMLQATISLRRVGIQLPTAKLDLDQAYQDRDAENAIGYNTPNTIFVYNPIKFNLGCFLNCFMFYLFLMCCSYSYRVCQASTILCLRRKPWLDCHVEGHKKKNQLHKTVFSCGDAFSWISRELTVIRCVMPPQK